MPIATHQDVIHLPDRKFEQKRCSFIRCTEFPKFAAMGDSAKERGWSYYEVQAGHDAMLTHPAQLAEVFIRIAREGGSESRAGEEEHG
jgi:hypothetical protein